MEGLKGNLAHDIPYLAVGVIIWPVCYAAGFIIGLWRYVIRKDTKQ